jgi:hypothetical protein
MSTRPAGSRSPAQPSSATASSGHSTEETSGESWMTLDRLWHATSPAGSPQQSPVRHGGGGGGGGGIAHTASAAARRSLSVAMPSPVGGKTSRSILLSSPYASASPSTRPGARWNAHEVEIESPSRPVLDEYQWPSSQTSICTSTPSVRGQSPATQAWVSTKDPGHGLEQLRVAPMPDTELDLAPEPEPEPEPELEPTLMPPPRPKLSDSDSMMIALARVHGLSTPDGMIGLDKPLGVTWSTSFDTAASRSSIGARTASNKSMSLLEHRPAGADHFRMDQPGYLHTRRSTRQLAPWIVGAAGYGERQSEVKRAKERRERRHRLHRKSRLQKELTEVGDRTWYRKMAERTRREAEQQAAAVAAPRKAMQAEKARRARSQDIAQEQALEGVFQRIVALYS